MLLGANLVSPHWVQGRYGLSWSSLQYREMSPRGRFQKIRPSRWGAASTDLAARHPSSENVIRSQSSFVSSFLEEISLVVFDHCALTSFFLNRGESNMSSAPLARRSWWGYAKIGRLLPDGRSYTASEFHHPHVQSP